MRRIAIFGITLAGLFVNAFAIADDYSIRSATEWRSATADGVVVAGSGLALKDGLEGEWTSAWHEWSSTIASATVTEADRDGDGNADVISGWREATGENRLIPIDSLNGKRWRLRLTATETSGTPKVTGLVVRR